MMVAGYATDFSELANNRNLILAGAFAKLISNGWQPAMLLAHEGPPIGEWLKIAENFRGLFLVGKLDDSERAQTAIAGIEAGELRGLSLSRFIGARAQRDDGVNVCSEVFHCREISFVSEPGNPGALIEAICMGSA